MMSTLFAVLLLLASCGLATSAAPTKDEVRSLFTKWNDALQTGDPKKVSALYAADAILLPTAANTPRTSKALIEDYFKYFLTLKPFGRLDKVYIKVLSDTVAMNSGIYTFKLNRGAYTEYVQARYSYVYQLVGKQWLIKEHHSSAMPINPLPSAGTIKHLFNQWNAALATLDPKKVAAMYTKDAILLPTVSNKIRNTPAEILDYFKYFLLNKPQGVIDESYIHIWSPTLAARDGIYTFTLTRGGVTSKVQARYTYIYRKENGVWKIAEHHSSAMPEQKLPTKKEIHQLFNDWNNALQTGDPNKVADMYAPNGILLPTLKNKVHDTRAEKIEYFTSFLKLKPFGKINEEHINILGPNHAVNDGIYTFTITQDGKRVDVTARYSYVYTKIGASWKILEHHSSALPEQTLPTKAEIHQLFVDWNNALQTGDPNKVADMYAPNGILLPTLKNKVHDTRAEKIEYFTSFLKLKPFGTINEEHINVLSPTSALNDGTYTFTITQDGKRVEVKARYSYAYIKLAGVWKILEHHSSAMPEK